MSPIRCVRAIPLCVGGVAMRKYTDEKECYCHTCDRDFHYLGIAAHRRSHLRRGEQCVITYENGDTVTHGKPALRQREGK